MTAEGCQTPLMQIYNTNTLPIMEHTYTRITALCPGLPGWAGTRKVKPICILLKQQTVSGSGISWAVCKSAPRSRQITTPAHHRSVFTGQLWKGHYSAGEPVSASSRSFLLFHLFQERTPGDNWNQVFVRVGWRFCRSTNSVKALSVLLYQTAMLCLLTAAEKRK